MENSVEIIPLIETKGDALGDLGPFLQFKKREKHSWKMVTFSKVEGFSLQFTKSNTPPVVFFTIFKLYKWYQIAQNITNVSKKM